MSRSTPWIRSSGFTIVELTIALFIGLFVVLAMGRIILANQSSWASGRDKAVLQQNTTEALDAMARSIRSARTIVVADSSDFRTFDETGALVHRYHLVPNDGQMRLREDAVDLVNRACTRFRCDPDNDTTSVTITVELVDSFGFRVEARTRAAIRSRSFEF